MSVAEKLGANKKMVFYKVFVLNTFYKVHLHQPLQYIYKVHFIDKKSQKEVTKNSRNQGFSYIFCLLMEGSGSDTIQIISDPDLGSPKLMNSTDPDLDPLSSSLVEKDADHDRYSSLWPLWSCSPAGRCNQKRSNACGFSVGTT